MEIFSTYNLIIEASLIIIISYFFTILSKKTNIPSVLMLIGLGIVIKQALKYFGYKYLDLFPVLEILGVIGVIMIVLEAALDLKITREKWPIIWKALLISFISLNLTSVSVAFILMHYLQVEFSIALLYALPLSVVSSAIIIPSVENLPPKKKEFLVYESTLSDIMGIMFFYFLLRALHLDGFWNISLTLTGNFFLTIAVSLLASYFLVILFQGIKTQVKLFVLIAALIILYSLGKILHLSSLFIILIFGLVLDNHHIFFRGKMQRFLDRSAVEEIYINFKIITLESSFVVRTFFFVVFGYSLALISLFKWEVLLISMLILLIIYSFRALLMYIFIRRDLYPEIWSSPRGLITILLFYAIPEEYTVPEFENGILLFIILFTSVIMALSLISEGKNRKKPSVTDISFLKTDSSTEEDINKVRNDEAQKE